MKMPPVARVRRPASENISVLLPAALAPTRPTISPAATARSISCRIGTGPYRAQRCWTSSKAQLLAEIGGDYRRVFGNLLRRSVGDQLAAMEHDDAVGGGHDRVEHVLDPDDRDPARRQG